MSKASAYFNVSNINSKQDVKELKRELDGFAGVISVSVNDQKGNIAVDYDTTGVEMERIENKIKKLGYQITGMMFENHIM